MVAADPAKSAVDGEKVATKATKKIAYTQKVIVRLLAAVAEKMVAEKMGSPLIESDYEIRGTGTTFDSDSDSMS